MPDGLITVADLRGIFEISGDIKDPRIARHIVAAGRIMRSWVGDEAYDDALSETPDDETRQEALELAEAHLAMHYAVLGINTALRARGIVHQERSGQGEVVISYHKPKEVVELQEAYLETARSLAGAYIVIDESVEPFGGVVGGSDSSCEAVTRTCG